MSREENPPFGRGQTFYAGGTIDSNNLGGTQYEGKEYEFEDVSTATPGVTNSNRRVRVRVVRNLSGGALIPRAIVKAKVNGATRDIAQQQAAAVAGAGDIPMGVVDEYLPAAGVPANDLFFLVIRGPTEIVTAATVTIVIGSVLVTAASGKAVQQDTTQTGAGVFTQVNAAFARALAADSVGGVNLPVALMPQSDF